MQAKLSQPSANPNASATEPAKQPMSGDNLFSGGYWRSMGQLENTPEFEQYLHREFPVAASEFPDGVSRRRWLKLMSASIALSSAAGCRYGPVNIASSIVHPENTVIGIPKFYATNFELAGRAVHLLVTNRDGRPIKVEGNAAHPLMKKSEPNDIAGDKKLFASAGTDVFSQACILGLYDPDRTEQVSRRKDGSLADSNWDSFASFAKEQLAALEKDGGESLAIVMSPSLSPSVNRLLSECAKKLPKTTFATYSSIDATTQQAALKSAAGKPAELLLNLSEAKVICCFDSDILGNDPNMVVYSRQFAKLREPIPGKMNRLYSVENRFSVTGSSADCRIAVRTSQIGAMLGKVEAAVDALLAGGSPAKATEGEKPIDEVDAPERIGRFVDAMAEDLVANQGASLVSVGSHLPADVQTAALRLNKKLGNLGKSVQLLPSRSEIEGVTPVALQDLASKIGSGVKTVWILGDNPVYTAPESIKLAEALGKASEVVYFAEFTDETSEKASWVLPLAHPLESWSDVRSADGTYGVGQPQILPLLEGKSSIEILAMLIGMEASAESIVMETASSIAGAKLSTRAWREVLESGFIADSGTESMTVSSDLSGEPASGTVDIESVDKDSLELLLIESDTLYDGRFAKNVWLQELPQAITKLVWDNAAMISPATASQIGAGQGDVIRIVAGGKELELPVFIVPGQAAGTIVTQLGYGRVCRDEAVNSNKQVVIGKDVSVLRSPEAMHLISDVEARPTGRTYKLATTQDHFAIDQVGLDGIAERLSRLVREATLEQVDAGGSELIEHMGIHHPPLESLWEEPIETLESDPTVPYQWGMSIDLNKCTGCNSCVIACQAENNIPVVGKEQVSRGREMHWIRVDRYFRGDIAAPQMVQQPVACVHCETAPCEQVCPVAATVHTEEGINAMAYNRCVGTRYCANNCPYKVRRFNYFNYNTEYGYFYGWQQRGQLDEANRKLQQLVLNPEVSVRGRGVMEKCTYCIQRVQNGKITARNEGRAVMDGEIQSACQAACPTQAIIFGDVKNPRSKVSLAHNDERCYALLEELNIKPRTQYLARIRNTHPRLLASYQILDAHHAGDHGAGHSEEHGHEDHGTEAHATSTSSKADHATPAADHTTDH